MQTNLTPITDPQPSQKQQDKFFDYYMKKGTKTYMNISLSAQKAALSPDHTNTAHRSDWFIRGYPQRKRAIQNELADVVLEETLQMETTQTKSTKDGILYEEVDASLVGHRLKAATFVKERLDKENYSPRQEQVTTHTVNIFQTLKEIKLLNTEPTKPSQPIIDITPDNNQNE